MTAREVKVKPPPPEIFDPEYSIGFGLSLLVAIMGTSIRQFSYKLKLEIGILGLLLGGISNILCLRSEKVFTQLFWDGIGISLVSFAALPLGWEMILTKPFDVNGKTPFKDLYL